VLHLVKALVGNVHILTVSIVVAALSLGLVSNPVHTPSIAPSVSTTTDPQTSTIRSRGTIAVTQPSVVSIPNVAPNGPGRAPDQPDHVDAVNQTAVPATPPSTLPSDTASASPDMSCMTCTPTQSRCASVCPPITPTSGCRVCSRTSSDSTELPRACPLYCAL
jgi:hypothetical protein